MAAWPGSLTYTNRLQELLNVSPSRVYELGKRAMDYVLAIVMLIATAPILLLSMALIRLSSPGRVILKQNRLGKDGRPFDMYKLRTMYTNAESDSGPMRAMANDHRVVPSCRWMRRSHIDELPQLLNVLRGEMSLVGPRPERPEIAQEIYQALPEFRHRLVIRPGITGLAQVCNGYDTCLDAVRLKLRYDLDYIRRRSWLLDLWILAVTPTKLYDASAR